MPVSNENLVYIFQGITDDGKYYINAGFRITNTLLEDNVLEFPPEIAADMDGSITKAYFAKFKQKLDEGTQTFLRGLQ